MCEHGLIIGNVYVWDLRHSCYLILVVNSECACTFMWCYGFGCEIFGYMYICMNMYVNSVDKKKGKEVLHFFGNNANFCRLWSADGNSGCATNFRRLPSASPG